MVNDHILLKCSILLLPVSLSLCLFVCLSSLFLFLSLFLSLSFIFFFFSLSFAVSLFLYVCLSSYLYFSPLPIFLSQADCMAGYTKTYIPVLTHDSTMLSKCIVSSCFFCRSAQSVCAIGWFKHTCNNGPWLNLCFIGAQLLNMRLVDQ